MRKTVFILLFLFSAIAVNSQDTEMSASEISSFKGKVIAEAKKTNSIKSDFVQYKHLDFLSNDVETSGIMVFKSPDLVKWAYTKPYQYSVVFKDENLLINDGGTKSKVDIGNSKMFKKLNELIVNSVKGSMFDEDEFSIKYFQVSKAYKVVFTPKDSKIASFIASFELLFNKNDFQVFEVKMIEPSKDFTRIVFSNRVLNSKIDDSVFSN